VITAIGQKRTSCSETKKVKEKMMKKICLSNLQYLLLALLLAAMIGCGANNAGTPGGGVGAVQARVVFPKNDAKMLASVVPAGVGSLKLTVTGTGSDGINPIPVVRSTMLGLTPGLSQADISVTGIYPGKVTLAVQAMSGADATGTVVWEGYAIGVPVAAGASSAAGAINMSAPIVKAENNTCIACHETILDATGQNLVANYKQSGHYKNSNVYDLATADTIQGVGATQTGCAGCHGVSHNDASPSASGRCFKCHQFFPASHRGNTNQDGTNPTALIQKNNCTFCHQAHNTKAFTGGRCISCHSVGQNVDNTAGAGSFVNDNNGVRAVTTEFQKNSHHVVGKALTDADCAVCHLEGQKGGVLDNTYHMKDNKVHLRNGNPALVGNQSHASLNNPAEYVWDPASPDHTAMDQFCMSCHNSAGAPAAFGIVSSATGRNTAKNPFADAISNGYDQMSRPQVVAVFEQFDTGNTSHHAVRGKKYSGRTRGTTTNPAVFTQYSGSISGKVLYRASAPTTPVQVQAYFGSYSTANGASGYGPKSPGTRTTIYEAGLFTNIFTLDNNATIGDDSTLHCGDCHTVGQWKPNATNAVGIDGVTPIAAPAAIGAHGSANEYLLRNSVGTDALMVANSGSASGITYDANGHATNLNTAAILNGTLTCYLCHKQAAYSGNLAYFNMPNPLTGVPKATLHGALGGNDCLASSRSAVGKVGYANRVGAIASSVSGKGTVLGIGCSYCHNAGLQIFGGIHGNATSDGTGKNVGYKTYSSNGKDVQTNVLAGAAGVLLGTGTTEARNAQVNVTTRVPYRFMGGVSLKYNGGGTASKWEARALTGAHREGCYNLGTTAPASPATSAQLWSVVDGSTVNAASNYATGTASALPAIANGTDDVASSINSGTSGWGSCGHHVGSNASGATAPTRTLQRPLSY
jgi:hypothetical protein